MVVSKKRTAELGKFGRAQGLKGEIRFYAHNPDSPLLKRGQLAKVGQDPRRSQEMRIERLRRDKKGFVVKLEGCDNRSDAQDLTGFRWFLDREDFAPIDATTEVYIADLIGLLALTEDERELGTVTDVLDIGPHEILVISKAGKELMVPYVDTFVTNVDLDAGRLCILVQPGLLGELEGA